LKLNATKWSLFANRNKEKFLTVIHCLLTFGYSSLLRECAREAAPLGGMERAREQKAIMVDELVSLEPL
jgi:hypothetical protein